MSKINISIPEPCHEDWHAMSHEDKGRFCNSCQKKVFDFTKSSDREIIAAFHQNKNLCGRFLDSQLNRDLVKPERKNPIWLAATSTIISLIGLGTNESTAQTNTTQTEQTEKKVWLGKPAAPKPANENGYTKGEMVAMHPEIEISGVVSDNITVLPGVDVYIKDTDNFTKSDFDGKFTLKGRLNEIIVVKYPGHETKEILIDKKLLSKKLNIQMQEEKIDFDDVVILGGIKKRTFFGRIFRTIGNWFR